MKSILAVFTGLPAIVWEIGFLAVMIAGAAVSVYGWHRHSVNAEVKAAVGPIIAKVEAHKKEQQQLEAQLADKALAASLAAADKAKTQGEFDEAKRETNKLLAAGRARQSELAVKLRDATQDRDRISRASGERDFAALSAALAGETTWRGVAQRCGEIVQSSRGLVERYTAVLAGYAGAYDQAQGDAEHNAAIAASAQADRDNTRAFAIAAGCAVEKEGVK